MRIFSMSRIAAALLMAGGASGCHSSQKTSAPMDTQAMIAAYRKFAEPGEHHRHLNAFVGNWRTRSRMLASDQPSESTGESTFTWVHGGRFLLQTYKGDFQGQSFEGSGYFGYDNIQKKYVSCWTDNMSTSLYTDSGTCSGDGKVIDMSGNMPDPLSGKVLPSRSRLSWQNANQFLFEAWNTGPDGKLFKSLEITYTRA